MDISKNVVVIGPEHCSLIESPELAINFFRKAELAYKTEKNVVFDLENCLTFTATSAALLTAYLKDRKINLGRASQIKFPLDKDCNSKLRKMGLFKSYDTDKKEMVLNTSPTKKVSNVLVANQIAKELVKISSSVVYGKEMRIKELYAILIELMANTNNHADSSEKGVYPWWLTVYPDSKSKSVKFVFIDLGVGVFDSIPVKQFLIRNSLPIFDDKAKDFRLLQVNKIFSALIAGKIKSSTGDPTRGKGLPLVARSAISGNFSSFYMIANDTFVNLKAGETSIMNEHFDGTLFYFELTEKI